jgi:hypothetical protein
MQLGQPESPAEATSVSFWSGPYLACAGRGNGSAVLLGALVRQLHVIADAAA